MEHAVLGRGCGRGGGGRRALVEVELVGVVEVRGRHLRTKSLRAQAGDAALRRAARGGGKRAAGASAGAHVHADAAARLLIWEDDKVVRARDESATLLFVEEAHPDLPSSRAEIGW